MAPPSESGTEQDFAQQRQRRLFDDYRSFAHASTLAACFLAPALIAVPPRKLDLYTFSLAGAFVASANYQLRERTGTGFMGHASRRWHFHDRPLPPLRQGQGQDDDAGNSVNGYQRIPLEPMVQDAERRNGTSTLRDQARGAWTGAQSEDWKQRRLKEEQEKLEQGEGYGSMIVDQIWEVWNQGEKKAEELKEMDEEVVQKRNNRG
ncbi:uncharacterized protein A1O5_01961 [Cladophialophora psammophila CBS 110553]|uniref:Uncharacterized protein n=1 Tax=Cladophialophora psammophila CBS 110553 TaxID=1182543 RepID=W9XD39_9EURO|nr:uncharacterized protein A1O5_01961 [Cladophialophora psammophila CBS 110553]EXJ75265.1 hypothetical protein A1O5_01961 [Cladophialophora psammophila CBS 110553]